MKDETKYEQIEAGKSMIPGLRFKQFTVKFKLSKIWQLLKKQKML